jgi:hypothetical protein
MMNSIRLKAIGKLETVLYLSTIYDGINRYIKINYLLIFLFAYTAVSKLTLFSYSGPFSWENLKIIDVSAFEEAMFKSPVLRPYVHQLAWLIPISEIAICMLLLFDKTKKWGYYLSFILLFAFTAYIIYILRAYPNHLPCVCGGVISLMSWTQHLVFNMFFVFLAGRAIWLMHQSQKK